MRMHLILTYPIERSMKEHASGVQSSILRRWSDGHALACNVHQIDNSEITQRLLVTAIVSLSCLQATKTVVLRNTGSVRSVIELDSDSLDHRSTKPALMGAR